MSKVWRCPECETINQDRKCVVCGHVNSDYDNNLNQQENANNKNGIPIQLPSNQGGSVIENGGNINKDKSGKLKRIAIPISIVAAAFVIGFFANRVLSPNTNDISNTSVIAQSLDEETYIVESSIETTVETKVSSENIIVDSETETTPITTQMITVPNIVGLNKSDAISILENIGLTYELSSDASTVIFQNIASGTKVSKEDKLVLTMGSGKRIKVPFVWNRHIDEAKQELDMAGIKYRIEYGINDNFYKDFVYEQSTEYNQEIYEEEVITLKVNTAGITSEKIPDYQGKTVDDYTEELTKLGLPFVVIMCPSDTVPEGYVINIDGGNVGEYHNGIHALNVYQAFQESKSEHNMIASSQSDNKECVIINGNSYAIDTTALDLHNCGLTNDDIKDLSKMTSLEVLWLNENKISDITPLSKLINLKELHLGNNNIRNLKPLSSLINLQELYLSINDIEDVSPLSNLTNLTLLSIRNNNISDISSLSNLTKLEQFSVNNNNISDISVMQNMKKLQRAWLHNNKINDISPLSDLSNLVQLHLTGNDIHNIDALSSLLKMNFLYLDNNNISDISALSEMEKLVILDLDNNNVTNVTYLQNCVKLQELHLSNNNVDKSLTNELLKEYIPDCIIYFAEENKYKDD